jgi:phosphoribosylformylglycinamidine synthase
MWAAKLPGEGAALYDACIAMCKVMSELGIAVDGGKDSLSMAARVDGDIVKAPGMYILQANRTLVGICNCLTIQGAFYPSAIL